jgi:hypothetical protein
MILRAALLSISPFINISTAICNLLLVHVLSGGNFVGARVTPPPLLRLN